ncbi:hypothetical protein MSAN_02413500 [Mycena sanguinolenta]|uniref:Uncharacterized protein n=1 Tax=Mycena sanguinolenta TaxID=230812 RepID=A0A8H7CFJ9_9AGAR|nr:hypothetical protein MSAN_02413500 [Mycena sanguinolenta]
MDFLEIPPPPAPALTLPVDANRGVVISPSQRERTVPERGIFDIDKAHSVSCRVARAFRARAGWLRVASTPSCTPPHLHRAAFSSRGAAVYFRVVTPQRGNASAGSPFDTRTPDVVSSTRWLARSTPLLRTAYPQTRTAASRASAYTSRSNPIDSASFRCALISSLTTPPLLHAHARRLASSTYSQTPSVPPFPSLDSFRVVVALLLVIISSPADPRRALRVVDVPAVLDALKHPDYVRICAFADEAYDLTTARGARTLTLEIETRIILPRAVID